MRLPRVLTGILAALFAASLHAAVIEVEGPQDSLAGAPTINHCTLRKAIINSNTDTAAYPQCPAGSGIDTIVFLSPMTITFHLVGIFEDEAEEGDLDITESVIINGNGTIIDADQLDRVFDVKAGATLTLNDLHVRNGWTIGSGGAIAAQSATLNLNRVTVSVSHAHGGDGGGIYAQASTLNLDNSTISGNDADHHGGAIVIDGGTATISNSTVTGNFSSFSNLAGGIRNAGATTLRNTIVAGNAGADIPNLDGVFTSLGYNIIGELGTGGAVIVATTGDQVDVADVAVNLGPLAANGGPTHTHALLAGSIALDQGHSSGAATDQRGETRPCDDAGLTNATGGDGADVGAFEDQVLCVSSSAPDAVDDAAAVAEDSGANAINVLANDTDADGDPLTIVAVTQGANGSVTFSATSVSYTPNANFFGSDSFTYTIDDGDGGNDTATVSVTVTSVNDAPVAAGDAYAMNQDTTLIVPAPGVLGNDTDVDGDTLSAVLSTNASNGTLALAPNGSFTYTPDAGFAGMDSFTYTAHDGATGSNTVTVTIQIADTQAPTITASVALSQLWSPNNKLVDVGFSLNAVDNSSGVTTSVVVYSDEPAATDDDAVGMLQLRAQREGSGDGRVYLIRVSATDGFSNTSHSCLTVVVPKSSSAAHVSSVNAQAAAAKAQCTGAGMFIQ
ncbi:MAG TPA: cadherin-like domain-containing protein [Thermoanaerobaculia bacterium]|nr:cadherin-like domain-containing protein [Thermoanaerobaculia bacterium]